MKGLTKQGIENFSKLTSSERYSVPRFQRDYSWKEANWFDLWEDVKSILKGEYDERYMGYLVLLQKEKINEIIDGQQRLITISLMMLAFIENIKKVNDEKTLALCQLLKNRYIAEGGIEDDEHIIRLRLNEKNNDLYLSLANGTEMTRQRLNVSEKSMKKCLDWFVVKISELKLASSKDLAKAATAVADSLFFTTLHVLNDENAYIVFETLNARGVKLSSSDLLKNYLFQKVSPKGEEALTDAENKWRNIGTIIASEDLVDFIRYYWNSRNILTRKMDLYREITKNNKSAESVIELLDNLL
jgi:uncharacterized protein with ParB-like and HNH nuclease domain